LASFLENIVCLLQIQKNGLEFGGRPRPLKISPHRQAHNDITNYFFSDKSNFNVEPEIFLKFDGRAYRKWTENPRDIFPSKILSEFSIASVIKSILKSTTFKVNFDIFIFAIVVVKINEV
jgi:hypothetical protein